MVKKTFLSLLVMSLTVAVACSKSKGDNGLLFLLMGGGKPLEVTSVAPVEGGTGIAITTNIVIQFNREVDEGTVSTSTIILKDPDDNTISGEYNCSGSMVTFNPTPVLLNYKTYTVTVTTDVKDRKGNALDSEMTWSFTTVSLGTVENPGFVPIGGTYPAKQDVTINCSEGGVTIIYTTDETDPTRTNGTEYKSGDTITVDHNMTLKTFAYKELLEDSGIETAEYKIRAASPGFNPGAGIQNTDVDVMLSTLTDGANIYYTTNSDDPTTGSTLFSSSSPIHIAGDGTTMNIKAIAVKDGMENSLISEGNFTIAYNHVATPAPETGKEPGTYPGAITVNLTCGTTGAEIRYTTNSDDPSGGTAGNSVSISENTLLRAQAFKDGMAASEIFEGHYYIRAAAPTFNPEAGSFEDNTDVDILASTGAEIHYTVSNTDIPDDPTILSAEYTGTMIPVEGEDGTIVTIKAIAFETNKESSPVATGQFTIDYSLREYTLTTEADTGGHQTVSPLGATTVHHGAETTVTTESSDGYLVTGWDIVSGSGVSVKSITRGVGAMGRPTSTSQIVFENGDATIRPVSQLQVMPVADAGGTYEIGLSTTTVSISGSDSYDPNEPSDSIAAYKWDTDDDGLFGADDTGGSTFCTGCTASDATGENITVNNPGWTAGTVKTVSLRVTDSYGLQSTAASASILVAPPENKIRNIMSAPPYGSGNLNFMLNRDFTITIPKKSGTNVFTRWRFDYNGDGTWDTDWIADNRYAIGFSTGGWKPFMAQAMSDTYTCVYAKDGSPSSGVYIPYGGEGYFSEINAGSLAGAQDSSVVLGDLDGDGDLDLILTGTDSTLNKTAKVYLNDGDGAYTEKTQTVALSPMSYSSAALGDIDGDGDLDLVIIGDWGTSSMSPISKIYRNDGTGDFTEINAYSLTSVYYGSIALGDIDRDGDLDLVITGDTTTGSYSTKIYLNDGTGNFTESGSLTGLAHSSIALGDIDNDGDLDLIATGHAYPSSATSTVYKNDGSGSFASSSSLTGVGNSAIALGDLDGDGDLDLVMTGYGSTYTGQIYLNDGTGAFLASGTITGVYMGSVVLGDLDGDGDLDLIATGQNTGSSMASKIYLNDGSGSFAEINSGILVNVRESSMALGDIDGDGDLDLIFTGYGSGATRNGKIYQAVPHP